jgi:HEAT repeat protein
VVAPDSVHLARALQDKSAEVRLAATLALASARAPSPGTSQAAAHANAELLRMLAKDPEPLVRAGVLLALGGRRNQDLLDQSHHLATGIDEVLRPYALLHLGMVGGEAERRELRAQIDRPMVQQVHAAHIRALGALTDLGSAARFRALVADSGAPVPVRTAAAAALARMHDGQTLALLRDQFLRAEDPELLLGLAQAARQLAPREGIARDPEPVEDATARTQAAWARYLNQVRALAAAGSRGLTVVLLKLLDGQGSGSGGGPGGGARARAAALAGLRDYLAPDFRQPGALLARMPARPLSDPLLREIEGWFQPRL